MSGGTLPAYVGDTPSWVLVSGAGWSQGSGLLVELDVDATPGLVDQLPPVSPAGGVVGQEDVARTEDEAAAVASGEPQGAGEDDDVLAARRVVPVQGTARGPIPRPARLAPRRLRAVRIPR